MGELLLVKGQNVPVDGGVASLRLSVRWSTTADPVDVDVVALMLGADGRVRSDADMIFYNQPATADGSVVLAGKVAADAGGSGDVLVDLSAVEPGVRSLTLVATTDGATLADLQALEWLVIDERSNALARFPVAGLTTERAVVVGEVYRRDDGWRLRAVGQGWQGGLAGLATDYGVDVDPAGAGPDGEADGDGEIEDEVDGHGVAQDEADDPTADDPTGEHRTDDVLTSELTDDLMPADPPAMGPAPTGPAPTGPAPAGSAPDRAPAGRTPPAPAEPTAAEPAAAEPAAAEPAAVDPAAVEPAAVEPAAVEPTAGPPPDAGRPASHPSGPPLGTRHRRVRIATPKPVALEPRRLAEDAAWQDSRLVSISGIGGADAQEKRATSALLWAMAAVRPLGRALTARAGAPAGALETFIEVGFPLGERRVIPDGVIRIARGEQVWTALVEVKTGDGMLGRDQIETYLRLAKRRRYDAVLTISNQISTEPDVHPVEVAATVSTAVGLVHISWSEVMHEIRMLLSHHRFTDPLPLWILAELDRYLGHPRSGAMPFNDMGPSWVSVRESVGAGTLRPGDAKAVPIVNSWHKLIRQLSLGLTARLGVPVRPIVPRRLQGDPSARLDEGTHRLGDHGRLAARLRVPDAAGPIGIVADLRTTQVHVSIEIGAPQESSLGRRVTWLTKQLKDAPDDLLVEARFAPRAETTCERLADVRARPQSLLPGKDWEPTMFVVSRVHPMGTKRSGARGSFVTSVSDAVDEFYTQVVERVRPWTPPAPPLPPAESEPEPRAPRAEPAESPDR